MIHGDWPFSELARMVLRDSAGKLYGLNQVTTVTFKSISALAVRPIAEAHLRSSYGDR